MLNSEVIMTTEEKKKIAELERDLKKMQRDNKKTFAEFKKKKTSSQNSGKGTGLFKRLFGR